MPFVGTFDIETGDPIKLYRFYNSTISTINGFISYVHDETSEGDFLGNVHFSTDPYAVYRLSQNGDFLWKTYLNIDNYD